MTDVLYAAAVLVLVIALAVTGLGAFVWGRAISSAVQARAHGNEADAQEATMRYAASAIDDAPRKQPPPQRISDEELRAAQQWQREADRSMGEPEEEAPSIDDRPSFEEMNNTGLFKAARE